MAHAKPVPDPELVARGSLNAWLCESLRGGEHDASEGNEGLPSFTPRAFAAASASFVRREIASRSCCATNAMMSTARNRTLLSCRVSRKAALRERRSSLPMTSVVLVSPATRTRS
jgi:hypothetical protein